MARERFVELRRRALDSLKTHHLAGNPEITVERCPRAMPDIHGHLATRRARGGAFDTHCLYFFEVAKAEDAWHISAITQKVLWNDGDPTLHAGVQKA